MPKVVEEKCFALKKYFWYRGNFDPVVYIQNILPCSSSLYIEESRTKLTNFLKNCALRKQKEKRKPASHQRCVSFLRIKGIKMVCILTSY